MPACLPEFLSTYVLVMQRHPVPAAERNDDFRQDALNQLPKDKAIIVYCGLGGTIQTGTKPVKLSGKSYKDDPDRQFGRETRSLKACFELFEASLQEQYLSSRAGCCVVAMACF